MENHGKSTAVWRGPISNPNRGWGLPTFGIILSLSSRTCFLFRNLGQFLFWIGCRKGAFPVTDESPMISLKLRRTMGNLPLFGEALFRTLIADGASPFSASFQPSPRGPVFVPQFGPCLFAISYRTGPFLETDGLPMIPLKFRRIVGNLPLFEEALVRTLITAGNANSPGSF